MNQEMIVQLLTNTIVLALMIASPFLIVTLLVGLIISVFQAVTSINEMTLTFIPKILVILLGLLFFSSWMLQHLMTFAISTFEQIPFYIR